MEKVSYQHKPIKSIASFCLYFPLINLRNGNDDVICTLFLPLPIQLSNFVFWVAVAAAAVRVYYDGFDGSFKEVDCVNVLQNDK